MDNETTQQTIQPVLVTARELAAMLAIGERTLWRMLSQGKVISPIKIGGSTRWRADEVRAWVNAGCPAADSGDNVSGGRTEWHPSTN